MGLHRHAHGREHDGSGTVSGPAADDAGSFVVPDIDAAAAQAEIQRRMRDLDADVAGVPEDSDPDVDFDFDAHWRARRARPKTIKVLGKRRELPRSVPAKVMLFAMRGERQAQRKVRLEEVLDMLGSLLGQENLDEFLAGGLGLDELTDVLAYCMRQYNKTSRAQVGTGSSGEAAAGSSKPGSSSTASSATTGPSTPTGDGTSA
jgi:hypothetical protein